MANREYAVRQISVLSLLQTYTIDKDKLLYGPNESAGYPINEILKAIAYVIADDTELFGNRPRGYIKILDTHTTANPTLCVEMRIPDLLTPLVIASNGRGALIGAVNPTVYSRLISRDATNPYKILVRNITEEDLRNAQ